MKKHNVHVYVTCRIKVCGIEAEDHAEAIAKADEHLAEIPGGIYSVFPDMAYPNAPEDCATVTCQNGGFADEITGYLVDEENDPEHERSKEYFVTVEQTPGNGKGS